MLLKVLNLDKKMDIGDVILKLGILQSTSLEKTSQRIFEHYRKEHMYSEEISHPSVVAMCVFYAAKIEKVKISKKTILGISNLTSSQWSTMEKSWSSWAMNVEVKKKKDDKKENYSEALKQQDQNSENKTVDTDKQQNEVEEETYDMWAKRILEEARAEMKMLKKQVQKT